MENFLVKYGEDVANLLAKSFVERKGVVNHKSIHKLRLAVKRARALLRLLESIGHNDRAEGMLETLREIYKSSGKLRDLHVQSLLVKKFEKESLKEVKSFLKWAKNQRKFFEVGFHESIEANDTSALNLEIHEFNEYVNIHSKGITAEYCASFIRREQSIIRSLSVSRVDDKVLHQIRKHLKSMVYTLQLLRRFGKSTGFVPKQLKGIDVLQEDMGVMNDLFNLSQTLKMLNANESVYPGLEWIVGVEKSKVRSSILEKLKGINF